MCNTSISEIYYLSLNYDKDELEIINNHPFVYYRLSSKYMFITEYCKLLESGGRNSKENFASLFKLDIAVKHTLKNNHPFKQRDLNSLIQEIKNSPFSKEIRLLRDKNYAHSEKSDLYPPLKINLFTKDEIDQALVYLKLIIQIFNEITMVYDKTYDAQVPSSDNRTENFIKFQTKYKKNYFKTLK